MLPKLRTLFAALVHTRTHFREEWWTHAAAVLFEKRFPLHRQYRYLRVRTAPHALECCESLLRRDAAEPAQLHPLVHVARGGGSHFRPCAPVDAQTREAGRTSLLREAIQKSIRGRVIALSRATAHSCRPGEQHKEVQRMSE